jgi:hypothetical protein
MIADIKAPPGPPRLLTPSRYSTSIADETGTTDSEVDTGLIVVEIVLDTREGGVGSTYITRQVVSRENANWGTGCKIWY